MTALMASPVILPNPLAESTTSTHPFTCNTCQVAFKSSEGQRNHMRTDWHRYNLKRRITELPPISSEVFAEKVISSQDDARRERDRASFEKACQACSRTYFSQNAYNNHVNSLKHKQRVAALQRGGFGDGVESFISSSTFSIEDPEDQTTDADRGKSEDELASLVQNLKVTPPTPNGVSNPESITSSSKDDESIPLTDCLFCGESSDTLQTNVDHMSKTHGLFIPEKKYLIDLEGLIQYLGEKILLAHACIYCNKIRGGLEGIRTHMRDKGHCMIAFNTEDEMLEIGEFYDFRPSYSTADGEEEEGEEEERDSAWEDEEGNETKPHEAGWETDSDVSSVCSEDIGSVRVESKPLSHHRTSSSHHLEDGWHSHAHSHSRTHAAVAAYFTETELHLPSGRSVGHRSLARYYRQNLRDTPYADDEDHQLAIEDGDHDPIATAKARSRAVVTRSNGGLVGASVAVKVRATKMEKRDKEAEQRGRERNKAKVERMGNNQKHFRDPNMP